MLRNGLESLVDGVVIRLDALLEQNQIQPNIEIARIVLENGFVVPPALVEDQPVDFVFGAELLFKLDIF